MQPSMLVIRALLLLLIAHQVCGDRINAYETQLWGRPATALAANVTLSPYGDLLGWIIVVFTKESTKFWGRDLLHVQNNIREAPPEWITLNLLGRGCDRTTLLVRSDNLYPVGFNTSNGVWYAFRGYQHLIPNSIELPYTVAYSDLMGAEAGGGNWRLRQLALGLEYYLDSLSALSDLPTNPRGLNLGVSLAKIIVMTIEAARFKEIGERVDRHWTSQEPGYINTAMAQYVVSWRDMSYLLLCSKDGFPWAGREAERLKGCGITNRDKALDAMTIILYPAQYNPDSPDNCKSTIEPSQQGN